MKTVHSKVTNNKKKIGLIGTSCSGKTTLALYLTTALRELGYLCEADVNSDRDIPMDIKYLDTDELSQMYMILQKPLKEITYLFKPDIDVLISDRSMIDLLAYYNVCIKDKNKNIYNSLKTLSYEWLKTYDIVFYLPPLPYKHNNTRANEKLRLKVDKEIRKLIEAKGNLNIVYLFDTTSKETKKETLELILSNVR